MRAADFARSVFDPAAPPPAGLTDGQGRTAAVRFDVYRNNVALSLIRVLEAGFPCTRALVGDTFFAAMAGAFARAQPPRSRMMMLYGDEFAPFIAAFAPAAHLGYLPFIAQFEQDMRSSYHARDAAPLDPAVLAAMPAAALMRARLTFAPSLRVLSAPWPILSIWQATLHGGPAPVMRDEAVLITRPMFDPIPALLPRGADKVVLRLLDGAPLGDALAGTDDDFDLTQTLSLLLAGGAIVQVTDNAD